MVVTTSAPAYTSGPSLSLGVLLLVVVLGSSGLKWVRLCVAKWIRWIVWLRALLLVMLSMIRFWMMILAPLLVICASVVEAAKHQ
nr:hypothetical protein [Tanacetum cinerariifolium]